MEIGKCPPPPLPKTNTIEDFNKYLRPISLTSTLSKIAEAFIIEQDVKPTLLKVIDPQQFGSSLILQQPSPSSPCYTSGLKLQMELVRV